MFTKDTLELLQQAKAIAQANLDAGNAEHGVLALPSEFKLHDLEPYLELRRRARGNFSTPFVASFARYLINHADMNNTTVFVDPQKLGAVAVLNLGTTEVPGHADNTATLELQLSAPYQALLRAARGPVSQRTLAEWMEDWAPHIKCSDEAGEIELRKAIGAVRRITIESMRKQESEQQALSETRSALESVKATSKDPLPTMIQFTCQPAAELSVRAFDARVSISTSGNDPMLTLHLIRTEEHAEQMSDELLGRIKSELAEQALPIVIGTYQRKG